MKPDRKDLSALAILIVTAVFLWLPRLQGPIDFRWDGGAYYVLGTSLAEGKGYRLLHEPGEIQSTLHPPMLPMIVALHQLALGSSDPLKVGHSLRLFYFVLFIAYAIAVFYLLRTMLPLGLAFFAALLNLIQLHTIFMSDLCFPELPFGLVTVLFVLCKFEGGKKKHRLFCAPLAVLAYALRTVGVALLAAWFLESVCEGKFKQAVWRLLIMLIPVIGWFGYIAHIEAGQEYKNPAYEYQRADYAYINVSYARNMKYKDPFSPELGYGSLQDRVKQFFANLSLMPARLGEAVSLRETIWDLFRKEFNEWLGHRLLPPLLVPLAVFSLAALIVTGIWLQISARQYFIPFYTLISLVAICATPWPIQFNRYLSPLSPFLSLSLFLTIKAALDKLPKILPEKHRVIGAFLSSAVVALIFIPQAATLSLVYSKWHQQAVFRNARGQTVEYRLFFHDHLYRATDAGLDWLKTRAKDGEVIAASTPPWTYLRTGLKSVFPPLELDAAKAQRLLDSVPVKYLIVDEWYFNKYTTLVVKTYPELWQRIYTYPDDWEAQENGAGKFEIYERIAKP